MTYNLTLPVEKSLVLNIKNQLFGGRFPLLIAKRVSELQLSESIEQLKCILVHKEEGELYLLNLGPIGETTVEEDHSSKWTKLTTSEETMEESPEEFQLAITKLKDKEAATQ